MSVASDLTAAFAEVTLTVPVKSGASSVRGFFDRAGTIAKRGGIAVQIEKDTLYLQKGSIPGLVSEMNITVGAVGAANADAGVLFRVAEIHEMDDGEMIAVELAGGVS